MFLTADARKAAILAAVSFAAAGVAAAPAHAGSATLDYTCELPYIGAQPATATVKLNYPATVPAGTPVAGPAVSSKVTYGGSSPAFYEIVGAKTASGVNRTGLKFVGPSSNLAVAVPAAFGSTVLQPDPTPTEFAGTNVLPAISFTAGTWTVKATTISSSVTYRDADGDIISIYDAGVDDGDDNTSTTACTQNPGQAKKVDRFLAL